jgi:cysteine-rich CPXCG protein
MQHTIPLSQVRTNWDILLPINALAIRAPPAKTSICRIAEPLCFNHPQSRNATNAAPGTRTVDSFSIQRILQSQMRSQFTKLRYESNVESGKRQYLLYTFEVDISVIIVLICIAYFGITIMDSIFTCAYCLEQNSVFIDPSGGSNQHYVEDCQVCCQPNRLFIAWNEDENAYIIDSEPES